MGDTEWHSRFRAFGLLKGTALHPVMLLKRLQVWQPLQS